MNKKWTNGLSVAQVRIARPTDKLEKIKEFYGQGLGLAEVSSFNKHDGYTGVMYGLPYIDYHLEFTEHESGSPCPAPTKDNLMVFYVPDKIEIDMMVDKLGKMGYYPVPSENPYWKEKGVTIEDPDGWRIVLMNTAGFIRK